MRVSLANLNKYVMISFRSVSYMAQLRGESVVYFYVYFLPFKFALRKHNVQFTDVVKMILFSSETVQFRRQKGRKRWFRWEMNERAVYELIRASSTFNSTKFHVRHEAIFISTKWLIFMLESVEKALMTCKH